MSHNEDLKKNEDNANKLLAEDLEKTLVEPAKAGKFGDFTENNFPMPKMELVKRLDQIHTGDP